MKFLSPEPQVTLLNAKSLELNDPETVALGAARTCYSGKGPITPEKAREGLEDPAQRERWKDVLAGINKAGHHTTFQHVHLTFILAGVSRQFLWSFLHSHPFYNSEQVSQRYVEVKPDTAVVPDLGDNTAIFEEQLRSQFEVYSRLEKLLEPPVAEAYSHIFPNRNLSDKKWSSEVKKKSQEIARYVLPIGTFSYLYHTVSFLTLMRYQRMCNASDVSEETRLVVGKMVDAVCNASAKLHEALQIPDILSLIETPEHIYFQNFWQPPTHRAETIDEFDASLEGRVSKLIDYTVNAEAVLASSVREIFGIPKERLSDVEAISLALDPANNIYLGSTLNITTHSPLARVLNHAHYVFKKRISHTADSQDQRHRMTPASRPRLEAHFTGQPDYITPELITKSSEALELYQRTMGQIWSTVNRLLDSGVPFEAASYLLPNAVAIRFTESGNLLNLHHKAKMRLCYNAQEEIWRATLDEVLQIRDVHLRIGSWLLPPCTARKYSKETPICPEGSRFCGVPVWKLQPEEYSRVI